MGTSPNSGHIISVSSHDSPSPTLCRCIPLSPLSQLSLASLFPVSSQLWSPSNITIPFHPFWPSPLRALTSPAQTTERCLSNNRLCGLPCSTSPLKTTRCCAVSCFIINVATLSHELIEFSCRHCVSFLVFSTSTWALGTAAY